MKSYVYLMAMVIVVAAGPACLRSGQSGSASAAPPPSAEHRVPGEVIVQFREGTPQDRVDAILADIGASIESNLGIELTYLIRVPGNRSTEEIIGLLRAHPDVMHAEPNRVMRLKPPARGENIKE